MFAKTTGTKTLPLTLILAGALALAACNGAKKAPTPAEKAALPAEAKATLEAAPAKTPAAPDKAPEAAPATAEASPATPAPEAPEAGKAEAPAVEAPEAAEAPAEEAPEGAEANEEAAAEEQPPTVDPESQDPLRNPAELARRLEKLHQAAVDELARAKALVETLGEKKGLLELRRKELAESNFAVNCPQGDDLPGVFKRVKFLAEQFGYTVENYRATPSPLTRREVPDELPAGKEDPVQAMDFVKPLLVSFTLLGPSAEKLAPWLDTLKKEERVLKVQRVRNLESGGWLVNLEAYGLFTDDYPILKARPVDFQAVLKRSGLRLELEELVRRDPVGHAHGAATAFKEFNDLINNLNAVYIVESELRWLEAKLAWLKATKAQAQAVDLKAFNVR